MSTDGTVAIPKWVVSAAVWAVGSLATGATVTIGATVHHVFSLQDNQKQIAVDVAAMKVMELDFVAAMNNLNRNVEEIKRDIAVLKAREP